MIPFLPPQECIELADPQRVALTIEAKEILYFGTRNAGKTAIQLGRWLARVGVGYGTYWNGILVDTRQRSFDDIKNQCQRIFSAHPYIKFKFYSANDIWRAETGESLALRLLRTPDQYHDVLHGQSYAWVGVNEVNRHPDPKLYLMSFSTLRTSFNPIKHTPRNEDGTYATEDGQPLSNLHPEICSTTNTVTENREGSGSGTRWLKKRLWEFCQQTTGKVFTEKSTGWTRACVSWSFWDNPTLSEEAKKEYEMTLRESCRGSELRWRGWGLGEWVDAGGAFDDLWEDKRIIIDTSFDDIPDNWSRFVTLYWDGGGEPCGVSWYAIADGEKIIDDRIPPAGSIIQYDELYIGKEFGDNEGTYIPLLDAIQKIVDKTNEEHNEAVFTILANEELFGTKQEREELFYSPADEIFDNYGIEMIPAPNSIRARENGLLQIRNRIRPTAKMYGHPQMLISKKCKITIEIFKSATVDDDAPNMVSSRGETSLYETMRSAIQLRYQDLSIVDVEYE